MSIPLAEALAQVDLETGKTYRCEVKGKLIVMQVVDKAAMLEGVARFDESDVMLDPWVEFPTPTGGILLQAEPGPPDLPDPPVIPEDE
jgi:hypothetical protein